MSENLRDLLAEVAAGRVDPAEAARRMDQLDADNAESAENADTADSADSAANAEAASVAGTAGLGSAPPATEPGAAVSDETVRLVRIQASARAVRLLADPSVDTVTVEGPHSVRREGSTVRIEAPGSDPARPEGSYRYENRSGWSRWIAQASQMGVPVTVRVNPDLAVDAEMMAGSLDVSALRGPLTFSITAGSLRATDCTGPLRGSVRAGSAKIECRPTYGESALRVESGSVVLRLQRGSDVRVRARTELGEVKVDGPGGKGQRIGTDGTHELVVGAGTATFDLDIVMGSAKVSTP